MKIEKTVCIYMNTNTKVWCLTTESYICVIKNLNVSKINYKTWCIYECGYSGSLIKSFERLEGNISLSHL